MKSRTKRVVIEVLATILLVLSCVLVAYADVKTSPTQTQIVNKAMESVVAIYIEGNEYPASGFYIGDGVIVTAGHVVKLPVIKVVFEDGTEAKIIKCVNPVDYDCGFIIIEAVDKPPLTFDDDDVLQRGDTAYLLGNPIGLKFVASKGIVSGFDDADGFFGKVTLIVVDCLQYCGHSGGPLIDTEGEVVGMEVGNVTSGFGMDVAKDDILTALKFIK